VAPGRVAGLVARSSVVLVFAFGVVCGLGREVIVAAYYGINPELEVFKLGSSLPVFASLTFGTAFYSVIVPRMVRASRTDVHSFETLAGGRYVWFVLVAGSMVVAVATLELQARLLAPGYNDTQIDEIISVLQVGWAFFAVVAITWMPRAQLSAKERFFASSSLGALRALPFILLVPLICGAGIVVGGANELSLVLIISGFGIVVTTLICARQQNVKFFPVRSEIVQALHLRRKVAKAAGGVGLAVASVAGYQTLSALPAFMDRAAASDQAAGTVASVDYSYSILIAVAVVFGTAVNVALTPELTRRVEDGRVSEFISSMGTRILVFLMIVLGTSILLSVLAEEFLRIVLGRGAFDESAVLDTAQIFAAYAPGIPLLVANTILAQVLIVRDVYVCLVLVGLFKCATKYLTLLPAIEFFGPRGFGSSFIIAEGVASVLLALLLVRVARR